MAGSAQATALFLLSPQVPLGAAQHGGLSLLDEGQYLGLEALQGSHGICKQLAYPLPLRQGCALQQAMVGIDA